MRWGGDPILLEVEPLEERIYWGREPVLMAKRLANLKGGL